jgi:chitodextrinase
VKKLVFLFALLLVGVAAAAPGVVSTTETSATVEGLDCGSKYRFDIRKYNADGTLSSTTSSVDAQTKACPDTQPPSAPQNLAATGATQTAVSVSWSASTDDVGVAGYDLYRGGAKVDSTSATSHTFGGLSCGTSYMFAVEAYDATGKRSAASSITASTAACPPPSCSTGEYSGQYYGNTTLSGTPVVQRCETAINYGWGSGSPATGVPADQFSTRWTGTFSFTAGTYQFTATADDGIRVWVDGTPLIDAWKNQAPTTYEATRILTAGNHDIKVEYYESGWGAVAKVSWQPSQVTPPPLPPPPSDAYFVSDFATQYFSAPWTTMFSHSSPGYVNVKTVPATQTPDGRVKVVPNPLGSGHVARYEVRDSDPGWAGNTALQKAELRTEAQQTFNRVGGAVVGDVRWFYNRIYMPYTATEKFEWPTSGTNQFTNHLELHAASSSLSSVIRLGWYPSTPQWAKFRLLTGNPSSPTSREFNLWQLTDVAGNRVLANHNRWIELVWGVRFAPDSTGWLEAWVDGVNVLPRTSTQTMWSGDSGMYLKQGVYKRKGNLYPSGASVIYFGPTRISYSKP